MPFKKIEDVGDHPSYLKMLKMELGRIPGSGTPYRLYDKFRFDGGKTAPLLLVGVVPSPLLSEIKKRGAPAPAVGTCTVNDADELVFDGGGDHGRIEAVVKASTAPQKVAPKGGGVPPPPPPPKAPYKTKEMLEILKKQERDVDPRHVRKTTIAGKEVELHDKKWQATGGMSDMKLVPTTKASPISIQYLKGEAREAHRLEVKGAVKGPAGPNVKVGIAGNVPHKDFQTKVGGPRQRTGDAALDAKENAATQDDKFKNQFVMDKDGAVYAGSQEKSMAVGQSGKKEMIHHSSFLAGEAVAAAGEIFTNQDGVVKEISNVSGHYRPGEEQALQSIDGLRQMGVDMKNVKFQYMDKDGAAEGMVTEFEKGGAETFKKRHAAVDEMNDAIAARKPTKTKKSSVGAALFVKRRQVAEAQAANDEARRAEEEPLERERRAGVAAAEADALRRRGAGEAEAVVAASLAEKKKAVQATFEKESAAVRQRHEEALGKRLAAIDRGNDARIASIREIREEAAAKAAAKREAQTRLLKPEIRKKEEAHAERVAASRARLAEAVYRFEDERARLVSEREAAEAAAAGDAEALAEAEAAFDAGVAAAKAQRNAVRSDEYDEVRKADAERDDAIEALELHPVHKEAIRSAQTKSEAIAKKTAQEVGRIESQRRQALAVIKKSFLAEASALRRKIDEAQGMGDDLSGAMAKLSAAEEVNERQTGEVRGRAAEETRAARKKAQADLRAVRGELDVALTVPPPAPPPVAVDEGEADPGGPPATIATATSAPAAVSPDLADARILALGILEERGLEADQEEGFETPTVGEGSFAYSGDLDEDEDEDEDIGPGSFAYTGRAEEGESGSGPGSFAYTGRAEEDEGDDGEKEPQEEGVLVDKGEARRKEKGKEKEREKGV